MTGAHQRAHAHVWVLPILSLAAFMASLDLFIVNVAFDAIRRDFGQVSLASLSWVLNGYAIVYAALLVPLGRLADRYGQKGGFLLGLALFAAASAASAACNGVGELVVARVAQAAGAALLTPTSLALLLEATPPERRARAVRIWAAAGSLAAAAGPVVGGLLVLVSWSWVFVVNVPIGALAWVAAARMVPAGARERPGPMPDLAGALVLTLAIAALALALVKAEAWGVLDRRTLGALAAAVVGTAIFVARSRTHRSPVVEAALFRAPAFLWSNVATLAFSVGFAANLLANILWMQEVWRWSALRTGLAIAPGPLMVPLFAAVAQQMARTVSAGRLAAAGSLLFGLGALVVLEGVRPSASYLDAMLPGWMIAGAGVGLAMPTMLSSATVDLPPASAATGSAVVNMARQVGSVLGVSILVALLGRPEGLAAAHHAFVRGWWSVVIASVLGALAATKMTPRSSRAAVAAHARVAIEP